jgi:hypothetical protein
LMTVKNLFRVTGRSFLAKTAWTQNVPARSYAQ